MSNFNAFDAVPKVADKQLPGLVMMGFSASQLNMEADKIAVALSVDGPLSKIGGARIVRDSHSIVPL